MTTGATASATVVFDGGSASLLGQESDLEIDAAGDLLMVDPAGDVLMISAGMAWVGVTASIVGAVIGSASSATFSRNGSSAVGSGAFVGSTASVTV